MNNKNNIIYIKVTSFLVFTIFMFSVLINPSMMKTNAVSLDYVRHDYLNNTNTFYSLTAPPQSNNVPDSIFGNNDMVLDYDTSVVRISSGGTGFIIGNHTIATAAHCVYSQNGFINNLTIGITIIGTTPSVIINPKYVHIPKNYYDNTQNSNFDYALIYVDYNLSNYGTLKMGIADDSYINNHGSVIVSGFPQEYPPEYSQYGYGLRFKAEGNITSGNQYTISYNADTAGGDSGGPVYVHEELNYQNQLYQCNTVIAIHTSSGNSGVRINSQMLKFYYSNNYLTS